ncbi:MAG: glutathione S-transferase N-terminal domain-containing protein [Gammaproteobacteria bacterium]
MLLRHSHTSPYVRKCMVLAHEVGIAGRIDCETIDGWSEPDALTAENPLSMVPTLVTEDCGTLYDSPVICEYLDSLHGGHPMIPAGGTARWSVLRQQALADGVLDCAILIFLETVKRPSDKQWDWWLDLKRAAIRRALDQMETDISSGAFDPEKIDLGTIASAVALAYLDLRGAIGEWRDGRPRLGEWHQHFSQRPSMTATVPPT